MVSLRRRLLLHPLRRGKWVPVRVRPSRQASGRFVFDNMTAVLVAAGCIFDDVLDVTVFVSIPKIGPDRQGGSPTFPADS